MYVIHIVIEPNATAKTIAEIKIKYQPARIGVSSADLCVKNRAYGVICVWTVFKFCALVNLTSHIWGIYFCKALPPDTHGDIKSVIWDVDNSRVDAIRFLFFAKTSRILGASLASVVWIVAYKSH